MRDLAPVGRLAIALFWMAGNACLAKNPAFVATSSGDASGEDTSSGAASSEDASSGGTSADECVPDAREPDDDESTASALGPLNDDAPVLSIDGTLEDATAQDWVSYAGQATSGLPPRPHARVATLSGTGVTVCAFVECSAGLDSTEVECSEPDSEHTHTMGLYWPGCCAADEVFVDPICADGVLDDMTVVVRVATSNAAVTCDPYALDLEF